MPFNARRHAVDKGAILRLNFQNGGRLDIALGHVATFPRQNANVIDDNAEIWFGTDQATMRFLKEKNSLSVDDQKGSTPSHDLADIRTPAKSRAREESKSVKRLVGGVRNPEAAKNYCNVSWNIAIRSWRPCPGHLPRLRHHRRRRTQDGPPLDRHRDGQHALTHCAPRLKKGRSRANRAASAQPWVGRAAAASASAPSGPPCSTRTGVIDPHIPFAALAAHVWFTETRAPPEGATPGPSSAATRGRRCSPLQRHFGRQQPARRQRVDPTPPCASCATPPPRDRSRSMPPPRGCRRRRCARRA